MKIFFYLFASLTLISAVRATNIVQNPSFEDIDSFGAKQWFEGFFRNSTGQNGFLPQDGNRMEITGCEDVVCLTTGGLNQRLPTQPGTTYTLTFWADLGDTSEGGTGEVLVGWFRQRFEVVGTFIAQDSADAGLRLFTITGLPGDDAPNGAGLEIMGMNDNGSFVTIDNVCVFATSDGTCDGVTTPEPASMSLLAGGFLAISGLAAARRKWAGAGFRSRASCGLRR